MASVCLQLRFLGNLDAERVSAVFREALTSFMGRRKSPLTAQMFTDLFNRFPVSTATCVIHRVEFRSGHHGHRGSQRDTGSRHSQLLMQLVCCFPGFVCASVGYSCAAHHICSQTTSAGKCFNLFYSSNSYIAKWLTREQRVRKKSICLMVICYIKFAN